MRAESAKKREEKMINWRFESADNEEEKEQHEKKAQKHCTINIFYHPSFPPSYVRWYIN